MVIADFWSGGSNKTCQGGDELSRLVKIRRGIFAQPALHCGGAHQVNRCGVDDFNRWNFRNISG